MFHQVTHNIKVSVNTQFKGLYFGGKQPYHNFSYTITIENLSEHTVQLISRYWLIRDALNKIEIVKGLGVIGEQPILKPGEIHQYSSGCLLIAPIGSMEGHYIMRMTEKELQVNIPNFRLNAPFAIN